MYQGRCHQRVRVTLSAELAGGVQSPPLVRVLSVVFSQLISVDNAPYKGFPHLNKGLFRRDKGVSKVKGY
jgi:hypothetical protein